MLPCSIPPLYCHDYNPNSVKWLRSIIKPTQRMEDERASSPTDLVFFNKMFSFIFSFVRKRSQTKLFIANVPALTKLSLGKAAWLQHPACLCAENAYGHGSGHVEARARKRIGSLKDRGDAAERLKP